MGHFVGSTSRLILKLVASSMLLVRFDLVSGPVPKHFAFFSGFFVTPPALSPLVFKPLDPFRFRFSMEFFLFLWAVYLLANWNVLRVPGILPSAGGPLNVYSQ